MKPVAISTALRPMVRALLLIALAATSLAARGDRGSTFPQDEETTDPRPNILLVVFEDMSPRIGAYGDAVATTPVMDAFAEEAILFERAFTTAGVCAPSRSSLITGHHQQTIGTQQMRTRGPMPGMTGGGPIEYDAVLPPGVKAFPELLRREGYYTTNNGKKDYQFGDPFTIWDEGEAEHPWRGRAKGQPFFAMVNILQTHESYIWPTDEKAENRLVEMVRQRNLTELAGKERVTDPAAVEVPPYLPDTPVVRADIARHYDNIAFAENQLKDLMEGLEEDGLLDRTIVIVTTDHGDGLPRMKRSVYDSGLHVPLMVRFPNGRMWGERRDELVSFIDLAPTILSLAGAESGSNLPGRIIFGSEREDAPAYIFAAADRHDSVTDRIRAVRDERFKYIRNYRTDLPFFRRLAFRSVQPTMKELWRLHAAGQLTDVQAFYFDVPRPAEELYDTVADPHEVRNLATDPAHTETLRRMSSVLDAFIAEEGDLSERDEAVMIEEMWPGMIQPETAAPKGSLEGGVLRISSPTEGASIGYRFPGEDGWRLYTDPIALRDGSAVEAKAVRYGFAESPVVELNGRH